MGDTIKISVTTGVAGLSISSDAEIVGTFDLFPTWYPESGVMIVGNLEELYLLAGAEYPHEVWLKTTDKADPELIAYTVRGFSILLDQQADQSKLVQNGLNTIVSEWSSADLNIRAEQRRPERQGLFGLLSVGFVSSALLTVLGFLLYALFSFRRRFIEMGMLRAIGLSIRQMMSLLAAELGISRSAWHRCGDRAWCVCEPLVCPVPANRRKRTIAISTVPNPDCMAFHCADLCVICPALHCGA